MVGRRSHLTFATALVLSLALHAWVLLWLPFPARAGGQSTEAQVVAVMLDPPAPPPPKSNEPQLGVDAPNPPSPTWLAFADELRQLAMKAEVEQAAARDDPIAAAPPPQADAQPTPPRDQSAPQPPKPQPVHTSVAPVEANADQPDPQPDPQPQPRSHSEADPDIAQPSDKLDNQVEESLTAAAKDLDNTRAPKPEIHIPAPGPADAPKSSPIDALARLFAQARENLQKSAADRALDRAAASQPAFDRPLAQASPQQDQAVSRRPITGAANAGAQSDRESDPTSTIDVPRENWQIGRPLAAHGLEVRPRKPDFTILTELTAWPRNPVCRICFDRSGEPASATIVRSSGDHRVDSAIEASLYRWRASGKQLEALPPGQTLDITMRLIINPERNPEDGEDKS